MIAENDDMTGKHLWIRQELATSDGEVTPSLLNMQIQLVSAATADLTIELDRTTLFSGTNGLLEYNVGTALRCVDVI